MIIIKNIQDKKNYKIQDLKEDSNLGRWFKVIGVPAGAEDFIGTLIFATQDGHMSFKNNDIAPFFWHGVHQSYDLIKIENKVNITIDLE